MSKRFLRGLFLILLTTIFTTTGQVIFKYASERFELNLQGILFNHFLWLGFFLYGFGLLLLILGLKNLDLTTAYPILSLSYIWVLIFGVILFHESLTILKLVGTLVIAIGVSFVGFNSKLNRVKQSG